jgi:histidinol-phosphate aminotransferase
MQEGIELLKSERDRVRAAIGDAGWSAFESAANFLLFSGFPESSADTWKKFLDKGILIRDVSLAGYLRVTIGSPEENEKFISAMKEIAR